MSGERIDADRRQFLLAMGSLTAVATGCSSSCGSTRPAGNSPSGTPANAIVPNEPARPARPRVVVVRAKQALTHGYDADRGALRAMLGAGLAALAGTPDGVAGLRRYFQTGQTVGLKVNGLAGRNAATHVELVDELSALLKQSGIGGDRQVAFDRFASDLTASGFKLNERGDGYRCSGNDALGYEEEPTLMPSTASRLARVLTERVDAVLNLPV
ncbi:MAG TPA: hypothetical protein VJ801_17325, partial [Polyangia bacterium]|nr:hypothetical protein [Polyangia bacterium]